MVSSPRSIPAYLLCRTFKSCLCPPSTGWPAWLVMAASALLLPATPAPLKAQAASPQTERVGVHVVRPGDTLESITAFYLGDSTRWRENWALNRDRLEDPQNPHLISPGQRLRVLLPGRLPSQTAQILKVSRQVEDRLTPFRAWEEAWVDDLLKARDGVRTGENSSTELGFSDDSSLVLTELSLVFLRGRDPPRRRVERHEIEIVEGQADLEGRFQATESKEIEIVLGEATARPRPLDRGLIQTRARRPPGGGAQLMVYGGESDLEAAGTRVNVPEGMGSSVAQGAPPSPPEELLAAPTAETPQAGSSWNRPDPELRWQAVDGARSYVVEVCYDAGCGRLVERESGLSGTAWRPTGLPVAQLYWRITAVAASGLDGYPSQAVPFSIVSAIADNEPPRAELRFAGMTYRSAAGRIIVGPGTELVVLSEDEGSGIRRSGPLVDGVETTLETWRGNGTTGEHTVSVVAVDHAGNETRGGSEPYVYDGDAPVVRWGLEGGTELGQAMGLDGAPSSPEEGAPGANPVQDEVWGTGREPEMEWSPDGELWIPLGKERWRYFADKDWFELYRQRGARRVRRQAPTHLLQGNRRSRAVRVDFKEPRFVLQLRQLRARKHGLRLVGAGVTLSRSQGLWIEAQDELCRIERMTFWLSSRGSVRVFVLEAIDSVGNRTRTEWLLEPTGR